MKIALVVMPWVDIDYPPLGVATLKSYLGAQGIAVDCLYFNVKISARHAPLADALSEMRLWSEWLFGYHLYGLGGTKELCESFEDVMKLPSFREFIAGLNHPVKDVKRFLLKGIPEFIQECLEGADWGQYDLIGFSSTFASHTACLKLSKEIKARFPGKPIVFGGSNLESVMGIATLKGAPWIDYVVDGEGEEAFLSLLRNIEGGRPYEPIPQVWFRRGEEVLVATGGERRAPFDLSRLPTPDHGDFFEQFESLGLKERGAPIVTFEGSRGCWWGEKQHCTFCGLNGLLMTYRSKSAAAVAADVLTLQRRHHVPKMQACDLILGLEHLRKLLPELTKLRQEQGEDWQIFFEIKSNLKKSDMEALAAAGILSLQPGIESLSTPILTMMRKGVRAIQNIQTLKLGVSCGIRNYWNILWGFPGEEMKEYETMAETLLSLIHLDPPDGFGRIRADRFSPYHSDWASFGIRKPQPSEVYRYVYPTPRFSLEDIAYFFDFEDVPAAPPQIAKIDETLEFWRATRQGNVFAYRRVMDRVTVYDTRATSLGGGRQYREHRLEGLESLLFCQCETMQTVGELGAACEARGFRDPEAMQRALDAMVERRWLFRENNQYLCLAVPASKLPHEKQELIDTMSSMSRGS